MDRDQDNQLREAFTSRAIRIEEVREFRETVSKHVDWPLRIIFTVLYVFVCAIYFALKTVAFLFSQLYAIFLLFVFGMIGVFFWFVFGVLN